jgi:hypothetical protein
MPLNASKKLPTRFPNLNARVGFCSPICMTKEPIFTRVLQRRCDARPIQELRDGQGRSFRKRRPNLKGTSGARSSRLTFKKVDVCSAGFACRSNLPSLVVDDNPGTPDLKVWRVLCHGPLLTPIQNSAVFSRGVFESPKWDVGPYDELVLKAADQLRLS